MLYSHQVWIFAVGMAFYKYGAFTSQAAVIRYTSLPTLRQAKCSIYLSMVGYTLLTGLSIAVGVIVFLYYAQLGCGPLASGI